MKFAEQIQIIIQLEGISQEKLAQKMGVSFATLNSWINGRSEPRLAARNKIAQFYRKLTGHSEPSGDPLQAKKRILLEKSEKYKSILKFILENSDVRDQFLLSLTYNTNRIEGSTLSESETAAVMFDNVALPNKTLIEQLEVKNHQAALTYLLSYLTRSETINEGLILKLHGMLMNGIRDDAGNYRRHAVRIVGANIPTANYMKVPALMKELVGKIDSHGQARGNLSSEQSEREGEAPPALPVEGPPNNGAGPPSSLAEATRAPVIETRDKDVVRQISLVYSQFEKIHPFSDGNGRIGRLLIQAMALRQKYPPAIILQKKKRVYHAVLNKAQRTDEMGDLEEFLCNAFLAGFRLLERK